VRVCRGSPATTVNVPGARPMARVVRATPALLRFQFCLIGGACVYWMLCAGGAGGNNGHAGSPFPAARLRAGASCCQGDVCRACGCRANTGVGLGLLPALTSLVARWHRRGARLVWVLLRVVAAWTIRGYPRGAVGWIGDYHLRNARCAAWRRAALQLLRGHRSG